MSRILQSIIRSAFDINLKSIIGFFNPNELDLNLLNLSDIKIYTFESHKLDTNNKIHTIPNETINNSISVLPDMILCTWLPHYNNAKNLSSILRIPLVNIIKKDSLIIKKESALELSKYLFLEDIHLVESEEIANQLFVSNYSILEKDIENQIKRAINHWIPN